MWSRDSAFTLSHFATSVIYMLQESLFKHAQAFKTVIIKCKYFFLKRHKHPNVDILTSVRPLTAHNVVLHSKALITFKHPTTKEHAGGAKLWISDVLFVLSFKGVLPTKREGEREEKRVNQIERQVVRNREAERVWEGEREICFERPFQVAISSVLIDNSPWLTCHWLAFEPR